MKVASVFSKDKPLVLLGCGNMGSALLTGWLKSGIDPNAIIIVDPVQSKNFANIRHVPSLGQLKGDFNPRAIVLAVKPQVTSSILKEISPQVGDDVFLLSVVAGVPEAALRTYLSDGTAVLRAMPNTPGAIGAGITGLCLSDGIGKEDILIAKALLNPLGDVVEVEDEDQLDAITAVSGSGPAYFFYLTEALAKAAVARGLTEDQAKHLAKQTFIGAAKLLEATDKDAAELRRNVTSPNGTTEAALNILMDEDGLAPLMRAAVRAAKERAREIAKEMAEQQPDG